MQKVLLVMARKMLAQSFVRSMIGDNRFDFVVETNYDKALLTATSCSPHTAVVEIAESGEQPELIALNVCRQLRDFKPGCKLLLLCPESSEAAKDAAVSAKKDGSVDDFIFYDSSVEYLLKKLESMG